MQSQRIAVVLPCYNEKSHILDVLARIGPEVHRIFLVDDKCPLQTGKFVEANCSDPRLCVLYHPVNQGVGGAMVSGYKAALKEGFDIVVKIDGDGQMPPELIPSFLAAITSGQADYVKGNRFFNLDSLTGMPILRLLGNSVLSFVNKAISGYWDIMDPTNGFTAIHSEVLALLPLDKIDRGYFFESDMLFRLNTFRAVVKDLSMDSVYQDEISSLSLGKVLLQFPGKYLSRFVKRILYSYFLRDFNAASVQFVTGLLLILVSGSYGVSWLFEYGLRGEGAPFGTVMVPTISAILGFQLLLAAVNIDVFNIPRDPLHLLLKSRKRKMGGNAPHLSERSGNEKSDPQRRVG